MLAAGTVALSNLGLLKSFYHRRNLARIPIPIYVNRTRGKPGVTRLIAAGLREGNIRSCVKTTRTLARMIRIDGREYLMFQPARGNVKEQIHVVRTNVK